MERPFVGIIGIRTGRERLIASEEFIWAGFNSTSTHRPMLGVLADHTEDPSKKLNAVFGVTPESYLNVIHYSAGHMGNLSEQLEELLVARSPHIAHFGVQLNMLFPPEGQLARLKERLPGIRIVVQVPFHLIGRGGLGQLEGYARGHREFVDDYCLDPNPASGGPALEPYKYKPYFEAVRNGDPSCGIAFVGGLGPENVTEQLKGFKELVGSKRFSIAAESQLRNSNGTLSKQKLGDFLKQAGNFLL